LLAGFAVNRVIQKDLFSINVSCAVVTILLSVYTELALKIAKQWERAVVLRLGRFHRLKGPGMFFIIPIVEGIAQVVDMRIRSTDFNSESTLTKDTVPVNAAKHYESNPVAMHLRGMNMLFEGLKEKGSVIIVPSSALETMNLGAIGGLAALSQVDSEKDRRESSTP